MGNNGSMFSDKDEPYDVKSINTEYKKCLHQANCNRLSYFNKRKCKRQCRALIENSNNNSLRIISKSEPSIGES